MLPDDLRVLKLKYKVKYAIIGQYHKMPAGKISIDSGSCAKCIKKNNGIPQ